MNKFALIQGLRGKTVCPGQSPTRFLSFLFDTMDTAPAKEQRVEIRDFCVFYVKAPAGDTDRNSKTRMRVTDV